MTQAAEHLGGEEWRDMDRSEEAYDPAKSADVLAQARRNIATHRKGDAQLRFVDQAGNPIRGLRVHAKLARHDFQFGEQLWSLDAMVRDGRGQSERAMAWKRLFRGVFNAANNLCYWTERPRNDGSKTEDRQGEQRVENFAETVDWTLASGMYAKGHPLFWSIPKCVPDWVKRYDYPTRMKFAEVRVRNLVARFRGRVTVWDAVNEPMWEPVFKHLDQRNWPHIEPIADVVEMIAEVLRWCREEDPTATFLVNDYGMEEDRGAAAKTGHDGSAVTAASQRKRFCATMRGLLERGCAPDAIGLQSHTGLMASHQDQFSIYEEFYATGLPVHITEFWANFGALRKSGRFSEDVVDQMEVEYIANVLTCAFGHPAVGAFYFWGFMGKAIDWRGDLSGHELRPLYTRIRDLINVEWRTDESLQTNDEGIVTFNGFYGDYDLSAHLPGQLPSGKQWKLQKGMSGMQEIHLPAVRVDA